MIAEGAFETDDRVRQALIELQRIIEDRYPTARFATSIGDDPEGIYLIAAVDTEDLTEVMDTVVDRLLEMQIDEELPVYVTPVHTAERTARRLREAEEGR